MSSIVWHFQRTTRRYISENRTSLNHRCENVRFYAVLATAASRTLQCQAYVTVEYVTELHAKS
jgi:hypothetical protein